MDRLVWYYHSDDVQCLEHAVSVATKQPVDLDRIQAWSAGQRVRFDDFRRRLGADSRGPGDSER